jgi:hypothetical protein
VEQVMPEEIDRALVERLRHRVNGMEGSAQMQQKEDKNSRVGELVTRAGVHAVTGRKGSNKKPLLITTSCRVR